MFVVIAIALDVVEDGLLERRDVAVEREIARVLDEVALDVVGAQHGDLLGHDGLVVVEHGYVLVLVDVAQIALVDHELVDHLDLVDVHADEAVGVLL